MPVGEGKPEKKSWVKSIRFPSAKKALRKFSNKILETNFKPCKDNKTGQWRMRYNKKLQSLF